MSTTKRAWVVGALLVAAVGVVAAAVVTRAGMRQATLPAGTRFVGALSHGLSTEKSNVGDHVELKTVAPVELGDGAALPEGAILEGEVTHSEGGGRIAGAPELSLRFTRLSVEGRAYPISAETWRVRGKSDAAESAAEIGGGVVVGGVVGAIAGKTIEGAVIGGILGTGVAVATKGNQIELPAGQRLRVTLSAPVKVSYRPARD
jgi:hypothetical protein